jgi:hypothetical protein
MRINEKEITDRLINNKEICTPLTINRFDTQVVLSEVYRADAIAEFSIANGPSFEAIIEIKSIATPKAVIEACRQISNMLLITARKLVPIFVAPYIGKEQAGILTKEGISWIDLSGNMLIRVADKIYIERTGKPNKFPDTTPIRQIFQGTSSLVSRALLLKSEGFSSLNEIVDFINGRNATITLSTVSKVLQSLENELLIKKEKSFVTVTQPDKLLRRLEEGYINYARRREARKYRFAIKNEDDMFTAFLEQQVAYAACGFYAARLKGLALTDEITLFVKSLEEARRACEYAGTSIEANAEFGQLVLIETNDAGIWFNLQKQPSQNVVDDIELYLELMVRTPRGPAIAEQLRNKILNKGNT